MGWDETIDASVCIYLITFPRFYALSVTGR